MKLILVGILFPLVRYEVRYDLTSLHLYNRMKLEETIFIQRFYCES